MPSVKKNFLYSGILTTSNYLFPLLVYPYVSRVLGVDKIGLCGFIDGIINYFLLFSMMGIMIFGTREIASVKGSREKLDNVFSNIFAINGLATAVMLVVLIGATSIVPQLRDNTDMMACGALKLISNYFLIEWFYRGMENFKFITVRTVAVKCVYVAAVFLFVKEESDYVVYFLLTTLMVTGNAIINMVYSRRFVSFSLKGVSLSVYAAPFFILGLYMILTSMYTSFNPVYLGFVWGDEQVGYYTTATKLYTIIIALFSAFTGVMLPRVSALISEGNMAEFKSMLAKSWELLVSFAVPAMIFAEIFASQIVLIVAGEEYGGAVAPLRVAVPLIFVIGYEQILVIQALMPMKKDRVIMINSSVAAVLSIVLNIVLVHSFQAVGSAVSWLVCEVVVMVLSMVAVAKAIGKVVSVGTLLRNVVAYLPMAAVLIAVLQLTDSPFVQFVAGFAVAAVYFVAMQLTLFRKGVCGVALCKFLKR